MPEKIIVLGCGLVGKAIALDLSRKYRVTVIDLKTDVFDKLIKSGIQTIQEDLSDREKLVRLISGHDLVIGALPGNLGYQTLETVLQVGKNIVDISFMPEDYFNLNDLARNKNITAVVDCGVAPGMSNLILGYHHKKMNIEDFFCYVGGLPLVREWPYEYKAVFSPADVIEEYTRPARFIQKSRIITKEALSDLETLDFPGIGQLEAWNSDGLRSLLNTIDIPNMIEKTLRYPGTTNYIKALRTTGFFSKDEIEVDGKMIRPVDLTVKLLFPLWKMKTGEGDFTIMKIIIKGSEHNIHREYIYDMYDEYEPESGTLSMARTTGYACAAVADLIISHGFCSPGICPPEYIGRDEQNFKFVMEYLMKRNIIYNLSAG
ncbi:MAG: saccharopine dehydrogenase [Bacteroides sp. SM23_62_1]|nr:MAG: saccharopine dehydrogenase [Bacteroides sp. SM23_62_1]